MDIQFWGVRGSIASPGASTAAVGGNTACVEVSTSGHRFVLDAGTGIRALGEALVARRQPVELTLLLSHLHWDHIQGLPFFVPAYLPSTRIEVIGPSADGLSLGSTLAQQMASPVFPVRLCELPSQLHAREVHPATTLQIGGATVTAARLHHPGGCLAWRIEADGSTLVYATDTEHYACVDPSLAAFAAGADVLIYDAQYTPEEYRGEQGPSKVGWGHSTYEAAAALASSARVSHLVLFHHDPRRTDEQVDAIEASARALFPETSAAREGNRIRLRRLADAA